MRLSHCYHIQTNSDSTSEQCSASKQHSTTCLELLTNYSSDGGHKPQPKPHLYPGSYFISCRQLALRRSANAYLWPTNLEPNAASLAAKLVIGHNLLARTLSFYILSLTKFIIQTRPQAEALFYLIAYIGFN